MSWPTQEQFDAAAEQGSQAALDERRNGADGPREYPLSGEWADSPTPHLVAKNVGYDAWALDEPEAVNELANAWEEGYFDTWAHENAVQAEEDKED